MSTILEHEQQALQAFQSNVAGLAKQELDRLEAERVELEQALSSVKTALRSVRATLSASLPKQAKKNGGAKKKAAKKPTFQPSEERLLEFTDWLASHTKGQDLTTAALYDSTGWAQSYCNMVMKWGRENGYVRQSAISGTTRIYRKL